jgi:hypothetical protein
MTIMNDEEAFTSADEWVRVSPKLVTARRLVLSFALVPFAAAVIALVVLPDIPTVAAIGAAVLGIGLFVWA